MQIYRNIYRQFLSNTLIDGRITTIVNKSTLVGQHSRWWEMHSTIVDWSSRRQELSSTIVDQYSCRWEMSSTKVDLRK